MNVLHGFTGSVASVLAQKFKDNYKTNKDEVKYVLTSSSFHILNGVKEPLILSDAWTDHNEWAEYKNKKTVLHIDLVKWADVFVIAPLSANTLAKLANGLCDNLLTCCARAWNFEKRMIVAPAMNTQMWNHPITLEHIKKIESWGVTVVPPTSKKLYCGDIGIGAMAKVEDIINEVTRQ